MIFLGVYWGPREQSRESVASTLCEFLLAIREAVGEPASHWFKTARSKAAAKREIALTVQSIDKELKTSRTDIGKQPMPELGYSFGAWNGAELDVTASIGGFSPRLRNAVVLTDGGGTIGDVSQWEALASSAVRLFDPDAVAVTSHEYLARIGADTPSVGGGLFHYQRGGSLKFNERFHEKT
jgi:hypothetical protein